MQNRALREKNRKAPADPIPLQRDASILDWLEGTGRLIARDTAESAEAKEEEEIVALMGADSSDYEEDDDDDELDMDE